jgi:hypothetical protein
MAYNRFLEKKVGALSYFRGATRALVTRSIRS